MFLKIVFLLSFILFYNRYVCFDYGKVKIVDDFLISFNNIYLSLWKYYLCFIKVSCEGWFFYGNVKWFDDKIFCIFVLL